MYLNVFSLEMIFSLSSMTEYGNRSLINCKTRTAVSFYPCDQLRAGWKGKQCRGIC